MKFHLAPLALACNSLFGLTSALEDCPDGADMQDCMIGIPDYKKCPPGDLECGAKDTNRRELTDEERRLQFDFGVGQLPPQREFADDVPLPYDLPCYNPSRNDLRSDWTLWNAMDDASVMVTLGFNFSFFGTTYNELYVSDNGFLSFVNTFLANNQPTSFPSGLNTPIIAPFWADAEVEANGNRGNIYFKEIGDTFAVIWDEVGYYTVGNRISPQHNSFQVIISKTGSTWIPDLDNICFCYLDMGWTHGELSNGSGGFQDSPAGMTRAATVGITNGNPQASIFYSQIGRFNETGNVYRGASVPSGVDFLDFLGSPLNMFSQRGFCFNVNPNLAPMFIGGPTNGQVYIPCDTDLDDFKVFFSGPEITQQVRITNVVQPIPAPMNLNATVGGAFTDVVGIYFQWLNIDFVTYGGQTFVYEFTVCDDGTFPGPLCTTANVTFVVANCGTSDCVPEKCHPITDGTCTPGAVGPVCTPWRSPEKCDPMFSFPILISNRYQMIKNDPGMLSQNGWWFQYTDDRAGAYSFTRNAGQPAPELYCCVTSVDDLLGPTGNPSASACFDGSPVSWTDAYVIRAEGHHSGQGVFVLPSGLDIGGGTTAELATGLGPITLAQVRNYLTDLSPAPKKFVVEKFVAGSGTGATATLPDEYKFHMFNGQIGSISAFLNRGTDCACYGEYSENWECLHTNGCFVPGLPMGETVGNDPTCYAIDYATGEMNPHTVKGFDFCGETPPPTGCVFEKMKAIAVALSNLIGVYVRIDMFVTENNEIYVQEYTFNHLGGTRHCSAKVTDNGCIDSCFLGKLWQEASGGNSAFEPLGGPQTAAPSDFPSNYGTLSDTAQCATALGQIVAVVTPEC